MGAVASLMFDYRSLRASEARLSAKLQGVVSLLLWLSGALIIGGVVFLVVEGWAVGWLLVAIAVVIKMLWAYYRYHLRHLPVTDGGPDVSSRLSTSVLGSLPAKPTPKDVAAALGRSSSGQFMAVRFGMTSSLLNSLADENQSTTAELWSLAEEIRKQHNQPEINGSILAVAIVRSFRGYESILSQMRLDDASLDAGIDWHYHLHELIRRHRKRARTGGIARDWSFGWIPLLERFGQNISAQMSGNHALLTVDVASHVEAVDQLVETFSGGGRQNAALVGQQGSGKTTIIHAFAARLMDGASQIPDNVRFRQVFMLDSAALIAAAPGRGELEGLIMKVLGEAHRAKNIIVCLDNAQLFFEEGVGSVDLTNVLQPILEAGNLRMILSMDEQRYLSIGRRNPGLINALNRISVKETTEAETKRVMEEQLISIEIRRNVTYMYQAIDEAYRLSERYVHDLAQPGRAIKLLESAAAFHETGLVTVNSVQQAIEKTLDVKVSVASDVADREQLLNLETLIHERMVNQSRAVGVVSDALRRARAGVRNQNRPIGTFLFLGPTGVGKTELSKALADVYFGGESKMIRLDLNEYVRADDVARLIADGADDPTSLTAQVMKQPFSVVLLDEIEKAAPEVLATLLQLLDEGILRDVKNREVSFRDAIVVATSNAGAERIREYIERGYQLEQFEAQLVDELINDGQFRPEFLNRFDEIVVFRPFTEEELGQILDLILKGVNKTLEPQKITVEVEPSAKLLLAKQGYDPRLGARPMRRVVQRIVENTVAKQMLSGEIGSGDTITITREQVQELADKTEKITKLASDNTEGPSEDA